MWSPNENVESKMGKCGVQFWHAYCFTIEVMATS